MNTYQVYQIKKLKDGIEVNFDNDFITSFLKYPIVKRCNIVPNRCRYCALIKPGNDMSRVKVIYGEDKDLEFEIANDMLKKPNLLPCFQRNHQKWLDNVAQLEKCLLPKDIENIAVNAFNEEKHKRVCASLNSNNTKDIILSLKVIQETLQPYLGPVGLALAMNVLKDRVFKVQEG